MQKELHAALTTEARCELRVSSLVSELTKFEVCGPILTVLIELFTQCTAVFNAVLLILLYLIACR